MKVFKRHKKGKLEFIRWDWKWAGIGLFLGRCNYVKGYGIEIFTTQSRTCPRILSPLLGWHLGWAKAHKNSLTYPFYTASRKKFLRIDWSGSAVEPWNSWTLRIGRFGIGTTTPKWIKKIISKRDEREFCNGR
jgi:hypothetical protein